MSTGQFFALVGIVYAVIGLVISFDTKDEADSEKTRNTVRIWACMVLSAVWVASSTLERVGKSVDALRVQEAQNACPCVGEEGE